jgi:thiol-disulfide isomerase/thioredoxin
MSSSTRARSHRARTEDEEVYYDEEETSEINLLNAPGRKAILIGALALLLVVFGAVAWLLVNRNNGPDPRQGLVITNPEGKVQVYRVTRSNLGGEGEAPRQGWIAPNFEWAGHNGIPVKLSDLRGKPVIINFWGTWCPPCRQEMPELQRYYDQNKGAVEMIGISAGLRDNVDSVGVYVNSYKHNWLFMNDDDASLNVRYQIAAVPSSYFIGPDGMIRAVHVGPMDYSMIEGYMAQAR